MYDLIDHVMILSSTDVLAHSTSGVFYFALLRSWNVELLLC